MDPVKSARLVLEGLAFTLLWRGFFARVIPRWVRRTASQCSWWPQLKRRRGGIFVCAQPEFVLAATVALHHITAGSLMTLGARFDHAAVWRLGMFLELGYEFGDLLNLALGNWPFDDDNTPPEVKLGVVLHHVPAALLYFPTFYWGLDSNRNIQRMCASLLLPSGLTALAACCGYSLDITQPLPGLVGACIRTAGTLYFDWSRMVEYPKNFAAVYGDVKADSTLAPWFVNGVLASGIFMGLFNILLVTDATVKMVKHNLMIVRGDVEGEFLGKD